MALSMVQIQRFLFHHHRNTMFAGRQNFLHWLRVGTGVVVLRHSPRVVLSKVMVRQVTVQVPGKINAALKSKLDCGAGLRRMQKLN